MINVFEIRLSQHVSLICFCTEVKLHTCGNLSNICKLNVFLAPTKSKYFVDSLLIQNKKKGNRVNYKILISKNNSDYVIHHHRYLFCFWKYLITCLMSHQISLTFLIILIGKTNTNTFWR